MSGRLTARLIIVALAGIALGGTLVVFINPARFFAPLPPLPSPPTIAAPRGELPDGSVAFEERTNGKVIGSGFLLQLPNGDAIGVTTAHSLGEGNFAPIAFTVAGSGETIATFHALHAPLGRPRTSADMTVDYVLMTPDAPPDPAIVLQPDPRGVPQPGERVSLYSGLGDGRGGPRVLHGTVESVDANGAWIRMDDVFDPSAMSGSPVVSRHTGQTVGMLIVMNWVPGTLRLGINPIGAIVDAASR